MAMRARRASDLFVECLEAEGVRYVFGIPGEETLDLNQSLANSSVAFLPVRHEQGGAYMARAPLVALTGQADLERMHKESHQFIDLVELFRPITKWNARVTSPEIIPEVVRKAVKV